MEVLSSIIAKLVESKLNRVSYSADEEKIVHDICYFV